MKINCFCQVIADNFKLDNRLKTELDINSYVFDKI